DDFMAENGTRVRRVEFGDRIERPGTQLERPATQPLLASLDGLAITVTALNETADGINKALNQIQARLVATRVGIELGVDMPTVSNLRRQVGFQKGARNAWRLLVRRTIGKGWEEARPLAETTREERIAALGALPVLVRALETKAKAKLEEAREEL